MYDANLILQAQVTKTASFSGASLDLITGTPRRGLKAKVFFSGAANATGANNAVFNIDHSPDNVNWYPLSYQLDNNSGGAAAGFALSTVAQAGETSIPFETSYRYVRLSLTVAGAGTVPTITYSSYVETARP